MHNKRRGRLRWEAKPRRQKEESCVSIPAPRHCLPLTCLQQSQCLLFMAPPSQKPQPRGLGQEPGQKSVLFVQVFLKYFTLCFRAPKFGDIPSNSTRPHPRPLGMPTVPPSPRKAEKAENTHVATLSQGPTHSTTLLQVPPWSSHPEFLYACS